MVEFVNDDSVLFTDNPQMMTTLEGMGFRRSRPRPNNAPDTNCPDPDGCEDALRAQLAELGIDAHHFKGKETLQKMLDEAKERVSNGEEPDELEALKKEAISLGIKPSHNATVNSLRRRIGEKRSR